MTGWTSPDDLRTRLRKRWDRGVYLSALARGDDFEEVDAKITGPKAGEINSRRTEVVAWVQSWQEQDQRPETHVKCRTVGGRGLVGRHRLPDRLRISTLADLERFLGTAAQTRRYRDILSLAADPPAVREWVAQRPMRALNQYDHFAPLLAALDWIAANAGSGRRLREINAAGVDTKFIENHQRILLELGALVVAEDLVHPAQPTIAGRFGFATPDRRVRLRRLDPDLAWPLPGFDDVEVRADDLAAIPIDVDTVYVVENLATYLSVPSRPRSLAIFGGGYAAAALGAVPWLTEVDVAYWGDLDTHGFAILDRIRVALPRTRSILMDQATLLDNRPLWGREPSPVARALSNLTAEETWCYQALVEDMHGQAVRLEQERIPLSALGPCMRSDHHEPAVHGAASNDTSPATASDMQ